MRFEQLLHETIDEMAGEVRGPSAGLAARSMAKGRRIRRTRRLAVAGGAVLAAVALALPWLVLPHRGDVAPAPVPATARPAPASSAPASPATLDRLPGGWIVTGAGSHVLDRATGQYVVVQSAGGVLPAPRGNRVLTLTGDGVLQLSDVDGTREVILTAKDLGGVYQWSPDGTKLAGQISQKEPFRIGFAVIDGRTGAVTKHWIDRSRYDCSRCDFVWSRDGREVVMAVADRSGGEAVELVARLQRFDAGTGEPTGSVAVTAMPSGPFSWSPDGRYVIADPDGTATSWQIVDLTSGQSKPFPFGAVWVTDGVLLAVDGGRVLTLTPDGTVTGIFDPHVPGGGSMSLGLPA